MSVVRVGSKWVNPDKVIWIGVRHTAYHGQDEEWFATIRCDEGQGWDWKCGSEEAADQKCDELAMQVNRDAVGALDQRLRTPETRARWEANRVQAERAYAEAMAGKDLR
jgi:hypothetical protein